MILLLIPFILAWFLAAAWAVGALTPTVLFVASGFALALWAVGFIHILTKDYSK